MITSSGILLLILYFDGSLRPPREPVPGFTSISNAKITDKLASCSAAIFVQKCEKQQDVTAVNLGSLDIDRDGVNPETILTHDEKLLTLGGRMIPLTSGMTSTDVEYEGLLLGLDRLISFLSNHEQLLELNMSNVFSHSLIIRGDCKVIIDQLTLRSHPRKMQDKYKEVMEKIQSLNELYATFQLRDQSFRMKVGEFSFTPKPELSIHFEHVLRENNQLCDVICKLLVNQMQIKFISSIAESISLGAEEAVIAMDCIDVKGNNYDTRKLSKSNKKHLQSTHFHRALDALINFEQHGLCMSSRIALACELTLAAIRHEEFSVFSKMATLFYQLSRLIARVKHIDDHSSIKECLRTTSFKCKTLSLGLSRLSSCFDDRLKHSGFTNQRENEAQSVIHALHDLLNVTTNTTIDFHVKSKAQIPFLEIYKITCGINEKDLQKSLQHWNCLASKKVIGGDANTVLRTGIWVDTFSN